VRKLIVLGVVVVVGLGALDFAAKAKAASEIAKRARQAAGPQASASASIKSFPFLGRLLAGGAAGDLTVTVHEVDASPIRFSTVALALFNVKLDKAQMFKGKAQITHIDRGTITVGLDAAALTRLSHSTVEVAGGHVVVLYAGQRVAASVSAGTAGTIRLSAAGLGMVSLPIPQTRLVSCPVSRVVVQGDEVRASCDVNQIPPALLKAAARVGNE
jgi:hypothetical protein